LVNDRQGRGETAIDYVERARGLAPLVAAAADEIERRRELTPEVVAALVEGGFFRLLLPRSLGGAELPPHVYVQVVEALAKVDGSTAWCLGQNSGCSMSAAYLAPEAAREIFGGKHGILAWGPYGPNAGQAVPVEGGWRVTGSWGFASGSRHATWLGAHILLREPDGTPRRNADGGPVIRTMLFPKSSATIIDNWQVIGLRGTGSDSYAVKDLFVPEAHAFGRDDLAERRETGPLYRFTSGQMYAAGFAAISLGMARGTLDAFADFARGRALRRTQRTLRDNGVIQSQVGQSEARLRSARAYLLATLETLWDEVEGRLNEAQEIELRLAATWAINQAAEVVDTVYKAAGADAIFENRPFERRVRDMHAATQQGQGRLFHFEIVGQILLGLAPEDRMFR
jgi:alkylation response protein AidB-like acyl-CoA dehydrogenase